MIDLLTIPFFHDEANTCIDDNIAGLCIKRNLQYIFSFINCWKFNFNEEKNCLWEKIYINNELEKDVIEKYCGIVLKDFKFENFNNLINFASDKLKDNIPSMLHVYRDKFPWDKYYQKEGVPNSFVHKAMMIEIKDKVLFMDSFVNKINEYLDKSVLEKCSNGFLTTIEFIDGFTNRNDEYIFVDFKNYLKSVKKMFDNIKKFENEVRVNNNIILELDNYKDNYEFSPLYNSLNKILRMRKKTKNVITYFYKKSSNNELKNVMNIFTEIVNKWEIINFLFNKSTIDIKYFSKEKTANIIKEVAEIEEQAYNKIIKIERL